MITLGRGYSDADRALASLAPLAHGGFLALWTDGLLDPEFSRLEPVVQAGALGVPAHAAG